MPMERFATALGNFPQWMREFAQEQNVPLIDLNAKATEFLEKLGPRRQRKKLSCTIRPTRFRTIPKHWPTTRIFNAYGAFELAKLVAQGIQDDKLDLAAHLAGDIETNTEPQKFPADLGYDYLVSGK
jgi:hypothetical protein